jgi:hypothetical protein
MEKGDRTQKKKKEILVKKICILSKFLHCYGEVWVSSEFNECSGHLHLISNLGVVLP